jgi:hypothetical protein
MRAALPAVLLITLIAGNAVAEQRSWRFDVSLDGKPIGYHTFDISLDGTQEVLTTEARFDVKFLFITAFRYRHENTEIWEDGCLASIDASTDSNGEKQSVSGAAVDNRFDLNSDSGSTTLPGCVRTFAYWKPDVLKASKLLNSQTGEYEDVSIEFEQFERLQVGDRELEARRYLLAAESGDIRLWYASEDDTWLALEAPAKGGRTISYTAADLPEESTLLAKSQ